MTHIQRLTVRELITRLERLPDELPVVVPSYEEGFDPVTDLSEIRLSRTANREWYVGIYEQDERADSERADSERALLLASRYLRAELPDGDESENA